MVREASSEPDRSPAHRAPASLYLSRTKRWILAAQAWRLGSELRSGGAGEAGRPLQDSYLRFLSLIHPPAPADFPACLPQRSAYQLLLPKSKFNPPHLA